MRAALLCLVTILFGVVISEISPVSSSTEISGSITGYVAPSVSSQWYSVSLAAGQVADIQVYFPFAYYTIMYIYIEGTTNQFSQYLYSGQNYSYTLAEHCPSGSARYFIRFSTSYSNGNYTLAAPKRSVTQASGWVTPLSSTNIGVSVGVSGQPFIINVATNASYAYFTLNYDCRSSNAQYCRNAGVVSPTITTSSVGSSGNFIYQFLLDSALPGTYYLRVTNPLYYSITTYPGSTCMTGCTSYFGFCAMNGTCLCLRNGYSGPTCTTYGTSVREVTPLADESSPSTETSSTPEERSPVIPEESSLPRTRDTAAVFAGESIIDIPLTGEVLNFTNTNTSQSLFPFRILNTNVNPQNVIRVVFNRKPDNLFQLYYYINVNSEATTSNYSVNYKTIYGSTYSEQVFEYYVCGGVSSIYLMVQYLYSYMGTPSLYFSASIVDASISVDTAVTGGFSSTVAPSIRPYYFYTDNATNVYFELTETVSGTILPLSVTDGCGVISPSTSTTISNQGNYQFFRSVSAGHHYVIVQSNNVNATFTGLIHFNTSSVKPSCGCGINGFCSVLGGCKCYSGWTGPLCTEAAIPEGVIPLTLDGNYYDYSIVSGTYSTNGTRLYFVVDAPAANSITVQFANFTGSVYMKVGTDVAPLTYDGDTSYDNYFYNSIYSYTYGAGSTYCVQKKPTKYYFLLRGSSLSVAANFSIRVTTTDYTVPSTGDAVTRTVRTSDSSFKYVSFLSSSCASAHKVEVSSANGTISSSSWVWATATSPTTCSTSSSKTLTNVNGVYTALINTPNCSIPIEMRLTLTATTSSYADLVIKVTPTPGACPNSCNVASGYGQCNLDGVCECNYPRIGNDCGGVHKLCSNARANVKVCTSNTPSLVLNSVNYQYDTCTIGQTDYQANATLYDIVLSTPLSIACRTELRQIFCDMAFSPCQYNQDGSTTVLLPCNTQTFLERCSPSKNITEVQTYWNSIRTYLTNQPTEYSCNPSNSTSSPSTTNPSATSSQTTVAPYQSTESTATPVSYSFAVLACVVIALLLLA